MNEKSDEIEKVFRFAISVVRERSVVNIMKEATLVEFELLYGSASAHPLGIDECLRYIETLFHILSQCALLRGCAEADPYREGFGVV